LFVLTVGFRPPSIQTAGRGAAPNPVVRKELDCLKKDKMFAMRMSSADYDRIQNKAQLSGMTMTDFLTLSALGKEILVVNGLDAVTIQLKAIGKNLNQLTVL